MMKPVKAFLYQDHQAHITVHMAAMQDPKIMQLVGQNPQAQVLQSAMLAHVNEHIAFEYRKQMEAEMGIELPYDPNDDDEKLMSPDMEVHISQLAAKASQVLLQRDKNEIAAQQAQQAAQDPIIQMQAQELAIKKQEAETKAKKVSVDAAAKADQLRIEQERIASQERIAGMQVGAKTQKDRADLASKEHMEGTRLGIDIAKTRDQLAAQKQQDTTKPQEKKETK